MLKKLQKGGMEDLKRIHTSNSSIPRIHSISSVQGFMLASLVMGLPPYPSGSFGLLGNPFLHMVPVTNLGDNSGRLQRFPSFTSSEKYHYFIFPLSSGSDLFYSMNQGLLVFVCCIVRACCFVGLELFYPVRLFICQNRFCRGLALTLFSLIFMGFLSPPQAIILSDQFCKSTVTERKVAQPHGGFGLS